MADTIEAAIKQGRQANMVSDGPFVYGFLSRMFHRLMEPPVKRKFKAPPAFAPGTGLTWPQIEAEWKATHDRLDSLLQQANGLDLVRIKTQSPASSWIRYPIGIAFWIQSAHDRRHLWQAREVINNARFPKKAAAERQPA